MVWLSTLRLYFCIPGVWFFVAFHSELDTTWRGGISKPLFDTVTNLEVFPKHIEH